MRGNPIVRLEQVHKRFWMGEHEVHALRGVDIEVLAGDFLAVSGSSGSGKSTLLNLMGCIDAPTSGQVLFEGRAVESLGDEEAAKLRGEKIGFIFQTFNLLPVLTALENVEYPLLLLKRPSAERKRLATEALERVGLGRFAGHRPDQLSGGQRQRVAIARGLVKKPLLILADEPTANLDARTAGEVLDLMRELNERDGVTFVCASHDPLVLERARRVEKLSDGLRVSS